MSFTRFHDDPARIIKQNQQSTDPGRWVLDTPGNGINMPYMMDPQIIVQKWGANLWTDFTDINSNLKGMDRPLTRDCLGKNEFKSPRIKGARPISYGTDSKLTTDQSRVTHPAWTYRDLEQVDWYLLPINPQENTFIPVDTNINTRVLEKDYFDRTKGCKGFMTDLLPVTDAEQQ